MFQIPTAIFKRLPIRSSPATTVSEELLAVDVHRKATNGSETRRAEPKAAKLYDENSSFTGSEKATQARSAGARIHNGNNNNSSSSTNPWASSATIETNRLDCI